MNEIVRLLLLKKSINPFNNVGLAITTLVFENRMLPKGIFYFFLFFFFFIVNTSEITYTGSSKIIKHSLHVSWLFLELGKLKQANTVVQFIYEKKVNIVFHIIRLHANYKPVGLLNNPWPLFLNSREYDFILWT